jgi:two-component system, chemotaxis family, chemotaxis protein CheY
MEKFQTKNLDRRRGMAKSILIVDDSYMMRSILVDLLTKNAFRLVGEAIDGFDAVEKYAKTNPDVVLMDITMPKKDGIEALREIKKIDKNAKVIMYSSVVQQSIVLECIKLGAVDFIAKPFHADRIVQAIRKVNL